MTKSKLPATTEARELTDMQRAFVVAFTSMAGCIGHARKAAERAGYSKKSAAELGRQLLTLPHV